ncbi:MAG TPA: carbonate dehydratase [Opitutaceae bacterium]|nr:carbonate dehydratase [Opitutaceae bacterium]
MERLFAQNRAWSERVRAESPDFFTELARQQAPEYLWIGCSDSRVPANQIVGLLPGQVFVHRNVANVVAHSDLNCLSVIQFAVDVLKVRHIIVCGHYGCSGVRATLRRERMGLVDNWLRHVADVREKHTALVDRAGDEDRRTDLLCELNVVEQVSNVCATTVVGDAWARGQELNVHGIIYGLKDGLISDLRVSAASSGESADGVRDAIARIAASSSC